MEAGLLCGRLARSGETSQTGLNRRNILIDFLDHQAPIVNPSLDADGKPLAVHQHCLKGPAIFEPNIRIDNLLDGAWH
jgi:hypothetical protein